jgi:hypothetical protein
MAAFDFNVIKIRVEAINESIQKKSLTREQVEKYLVKIPEMHIYLWRCIYPDDTYPRDGSHLERLITHYMMCIHSQGQYRERLIKYNAMQEALAARETAFERRVMDLKKHRELVEQRRQLWEDEMRRFKIREADLIENERMMEVQRVCLNKVPALDSVCVVKPDMPPDTIECPVCYEEATDNNVLLSCKTHSLCASCLKKILKTPQKTCPLCRENIRTIYSKDAELTRHYNIIPLPAPHCL